MSAYWVKDEHEGDYQDWLNELMEAAPDHYDGDDSMEHLVVGYIRDLEAVRNSAVTVVERMACNHVFDPECGRCEWMLPFRSAMAQAVGRSEPECGISCGCASGNCALR